MNLMKKLVATVVLSSTSMGIAAAAESPASAMLCAITGTVSCDAIECMRGPADAVNLPVFVKFDTQAKTVETAKAGGERRTSKIVSMQSEGDSLVLLGGEMGKGWSAAVDQVTGDFTSTIAEGGAGFILFGSCLPLVK